MSEIGAAVGGAAAPLNGAGAPTQLPTASFDSAMAAFDQGGMNIQLPDMPGVSSAIKQPADMQGTNNQGPPAGDQAPPPAADPNAPPDPVAEMAKFQEERKEWDAWKKAREESMLLPEADHDRLIEMEIDGKKESLSIKQLKSGFMKHSDYTQKTQAAAEQTRHAQQTMQNVDRMLTDFAQPGTLRERLEDLGFGKQFHEAAKQTWNEILKDERQLWVMQQKGVPKEIIDTTRQRFERERESAIERRRGDRQRAALEQQNQQRSQEETSRQQEQQLSNAIAQLRPLAFKHLGMEGDKVDQAVFAEEFIALWQINGGLNGRELRDVVLDAAQAAKERREKSLSAHQKMLEEQYAASRGEPAPLGATRAAGAPPSSGPGGVQQARAPRLANNQFDAEMDRLNRGGR